MINLTRGNSAVECQPHKLKVASSNLARATIFALFLLLSLPCFAAYPVTGKAYDGAGNPIDGTQTNIYVQFDLMGCNGNPPRVVGISTVVGQHVKFPVDVSGNVVALDGTSVATIDGNDQIECPSGYKPTQWQVTWFINDAPISPRSAYTITGAFDLNSAVPNTTNPVVLPPTGDTTYVRRDAGNNPESGNFNFTGDVAACLTNGMYAVGARCYATYAAARAAAGSGTVFLPNTASSSETVTDGNNSVFDLRRNAVASSHFFNCSYPMTNSPGGGDCSFGSNGAGDLYLSHNTHVSPATTTAATLSIGANASVLVGSTALFGKGPGSYPLLVGRGSANYETIAGANWSVVDSTHLSITCANSHSGTTDIEQLGVTELDTGIALRIFSHNPASLGGHAWPIPVLGGGGNMLALIPGNMSDSWPYNAFAFAVPVTGVAAGAGERNVATAPNDLVFRNADAFHETKIEGSGGIVQMYFPDGMNKFVSRLVSETTGGTPASSGAISLLRGDAICWRNEASSSDICVNKDASDNLNLGSANATVSTTGLGTFLGGLKAGASGSTIADTRNLVQAVYNHSGTVQLTSHMVKDTCTLGTDCAVTLAGSAVFTGSGSYDCSVRDATTAANAVTVAKGSGSAVTFTGTGTDVVSYICIGN